MIAHLSNTAIAGSAFTSLVVYVIVLALLYSVPLIRRQACRIRVRP